MVLDEGGVLAGVVAVENGRGSFTDADGPSTTRRLLNAGQARRTNAVDL
ncbi:hypothetical protein [Streptomyces griseoluteus]